MADISKEALPVVEVLLQADTEQLYYQLGMTLAAVEKSPALGRSLDVLTPQGMESLGIRDVVADWTDVGRRFLRNLNQEAHAVVCGKAAADEQLRQKLTDAFGIGEGAVAAALAALLVSQGVLAPAIATLAATLMVRLFYRATHKTMCEVWAAALAPK